MNIPPEKMSAYRRTAHQKQLKTLLIQEARRKNALITAEKASYLLKKLYGVKQVFLFGSLARQDIFDSHSDIDLAVQGLDETKYYRALADLMNLDMASDIDLVMTEQASPALLNTILTQGRTL